MVTKYSVHTGKSVPEPNVGETEYGVVEKNSERQGLSTRSNGRTVPAANTPGEAIRPAKEHPGKIRLPLTDVIMSRMNGRDPAKNLPSLCPHIKRLFMSGYTADVVTQRGRLDEDVHFIWKPYSLQKPAAKVREVLDKET